MVVLDVEYNGWMIFLSTGIAFIGAFAAVSLCEQYRLSTLADSKANRYLLLVFVAISLGAVGIWAMHYIATASFTLKNDGIIIPIRYNYSMLFVSLVVVCIMELIALYLASTDKCFNKSKAKIMEIFIQHASNNYSLPELKQMTSSKIWIIVFTHSLHRIILGGFIGGSGVAIMHYLGMMSMEFQGKITYNPGMVALSVIVAILAVIGGFWVFFRVLSVFPSLDILRIVCALNGMFSLSGVHYIGMTTAKFEYDPNMSIPDPATTIASHDLLIGILAASVVFCVIMHVYVLSDLRGWLLRTSIQLRQADGIIQSLAANQRGNGEVSITPTSSATSAVLSSRNLIKYMRKYNQGSDDKTGRIVWNTPNLYGDQSSEEDELSDKPNTDKPNPTSSPNPNGTSSNAHSSEHGTAIESSMSQHSDTEIAMAGVRNKPVLRHLQINTTVTTSTGTTSIGSKSPVFRSLSSTRSIAVTAQAAASTNAATTAIKSALRSSASAVTIPTSSLFNSTTHQHELDMYSYSTMKDIEQGIQDNANEH